MKTIHLEQDSQEWHNWRRNIIGGSDAPAVMGIGFLTPHQLYLNKLGLYQTTQTPLMERGKKLEGQARSLCQEMLGTQLEPLCVVHNQRSWQAASLDGIDPKRTFIVEIKTGGEKALERAKNGIIPDYHRCQIQHQLEVTGLEMCIYFFFDGTKGYPIEVYRDERYINHLVTAEEAFWIDLQDFRAPQLIQKDYEVHETETRKRLAQEWIKVTEELQALEKQEKSLREALIADNGDRNTIGGGIKISLSGRAGNIDYKSIPELSNVDVEKYRKAPSKFFRMVRT